MLKLPLQIIEQTRNLINNNISVDDHIQSLDDANSLYADLRMFVMLQYHVQMFCYQFETIFEFPLYKAYYLVIIVGTYIIP